MLFSMQIKRQATSKDLALKFLGPKDHIQSDLHAYQVMNLPFRTTFGNLPRCHHALFALPVPLL